MKYSVIALLLILIMLCLNTVDELYIEKENLHYNIKELTKEKELLEKEVKLLSKVETTNVGKFVVTAYSPYEDFSGLNTDGNPNYTATGTTPRPGTIAVDPSVVPYGSELTIVYPDGTVEQGIAEDTGGAINGKRLDVFRYKYDDAMRFGRREAVVVWKK